MIGAKTENQHQKIGIYTLLEITRVQRNFSLAPELVDKKDGTR